MSTDRPAEVLAAWEDVARSARAPHQPATMRSRVQLPTGVLVLGSIVLSVVLIQTMIQRMTPGRDGSPSGSPTVAATAPSASPGTPPEPGPTPLVVDGWVIPTPHPLPAGAVRLPLDTFPAPEGISIPSGTDYDLCPMKAIGVHVEYDPAATPSLTFNGGGRGPMWPYGVSARLYQGRAEIVMPDGTVLARDGDQLIFAGGLYGSTGRDAICLPGMRPVRPDDAE